MAELPRRHLPQRHVVEHVDMPRRAECPLRQPGAQPDEGRVVDEILVDAERRTGCLGRGDQAVGGCTGRRQRLFQQHRLARRQQRGRHLGMPVGRDEHVCAVQDPGGQRRGYRSEHLNAGRDARRGGQRAGCALHRIDDRGEPHPRRAAQSFHMGAGDEARANQRDPSHAAHKVGRRAAVPAPLIVRPALPLATSPTAALPPLSSFLISLATAIVTGRSGVPPGRPFCQPTVLFPEHSIA